MFARSLAFSQTNPERGFDVTIDDVRRRDAEDKQTAANFQAVRIRDEAH